MSKIQTFDLEWTKSEPGLLPIGKHAISDDGTVSSALRDSLAPKSYCLVSHRANGRGDVETLMGASFSMESVRRVETHTSGRLSIALTDTGLSFMNTSSLLVDQSTFEAGRGMVFLDIALAGSDPRRTIAILSMNRSGDGYTLSAAEGADTLVSLWTKTWPDAITAIAISANGSWIAVGLNNGGAALLNRDRKVIWEYVPQEQNKPTPIASICVDCDGRVASVDDNGDVRRHTAMNGSVIWRYRLAHPLKSRMPTIQTALYHIASDSATRVIAAAALYYGTPSTTAQLVDSHYTLIDGEVGDTVWHDDLDSPATGVSVSPNAGYVCLSTRDGGLTTLSVKILQESGLMSSGHEFAMAQTLYEEARYAADNGEINQAIPLLEEALRLNPTHTNATVLFDEVIWHIREETLATTTQITEDSLRKVDAALEIAPHDEKLTIRRNALARLVAEQSCAIAAQLVSDGREDEGMALIKRALSLDRHNVDMRIGLKNFQDKYIGRLYQESQSLLEKQMHEEAIALLEKVQSLRPDEPGVEQRLAYSRAAQAFTNGVQHYNLKHYALAIFEFKKALLLQPGHAQALRHLRLSQNPPSDKPATPGHAAAPVSGLRSQSRR